MNSHPPPRCAALVIDAAGQAQLDAVPDVVLIHERNGNVLFANAAARVRWPGLAGANLLPLLVIEDRLPCVEAWRGLRVERTLEADLRLIEGASPMIAHTAVHSADVDALVSTWRPVRVPADVPAAHAAALGFVADVSHELRTPLSAIVGLTRLLEGETLSPRARDQVAKLTEVAGSMLGLVGEVLDFAKIDAGKMRIERVEFDPHEIVSSLHAMFDARAAERRDELIIDCDPTLPSRLVGDPLRLRQVLTNLLGNALKFTEGGTVRLCCRRRAASHGVRVAFEVEDTGIGIEPERLGALFGRFEQAEASTSRRFGGSGLGLNISAQLVGLMGGSIDVESTPGVGSVFRFEVELAVPDRTPRMPQAPAVDTLAGVRVLVAEDNVIQQFVVSELLRSVGADVGIAADGAEAMRRVVDEPWHVVLMDVEMPGVDGLEVTRWLRQQAAYANLPIIAMTAHISADRWEHAIGAGMNDVVVKPVDPRRLREVVGHWRTTTLKSTVG